MTQFVKEEKFDFERIEIENIDINILNQQFILIRFCTIFYIREKKIELIIHISNKNYLLYLNLFMLNIFLLLNILFSLNS